VGGRFRGKRVDLTDLCLFLGRGSKGKGASGNYKGIQEDVTSKIFLCPCWERQYKETRKKKISSSGGTEQEEGKKRRGPSKLGCLERGGRWGAR